MLFPGKKSYEQVFLSTLSLRRATSRHYLRPRNSKVSIHALSRLPMAPIPRFYPRSPCGERQHERQASNVHLHVSIHALLAESDTHGAKHVRKTAISIHALSRLPMAPVPQFLSTLSLRRATTSRLHKILSDWDFYPRSPCGERRTVWELTV